MTSADIVHEFQAYSHLDEKGGGGGGGGGGVVGGGGGGGGGGYSDIFKHT